MFEVSGNYATAKVFAKTLEETAREQIELLCSQELTKDSKIRIMPDVHAGKGCTIGFTADLGKMVIPNLVGVDIGCGMLCVELGKLDNIDFNKFDEIVRNCIPCGREVHDHRVAAFPALSNLHCFLSLNNVY